MTKKQYKELN